MKEKLPGKETNNVTCCWIFYIIFLIPFPSVRWNHFPYWYWKCYHQVEEALQRWLKNARPFNTYIKTCTLLWKDISIIKYIALRHVMDPKRSWISDKITVFLKIWRWKFPQIGHDFEVLHTITRANNMGQLQRKLFLLITFIYDHTSLKE